MTIGFNGASGPRALIEHLIRFPEDLRDIRRLQRQYDLTAEEAATALESWMSTAPVRGPLRELSH